MTRLDISYYEPDGKGRAYPFWRNLIDHIHTTDKLPDGVWNRINEEIAKYNGRFEEGNQILFAKDSDATRFLLRWS
jgi:hypothetical protein